MFIFLPIRGDLLPLYSCQERSIATATYCFVPTSLYLFMENELRYIYTTNVIFYPSNIYVYITRK